MILNSSAARVWREDFLNAVVKAVPEFFKEASREQIASVAEQMSTEREEKFIA